MGPNSVSGGPSRPFWRSRERRGKASGWIRDKARNKDNELMTQCEVCKKYYLRGRGIKIHQKKAGCHLKLNQHRNHHKSEAAVVQEEHHSEDSSQVDSGRTPTPNKSTTGGSEEAEEKGKGNGEERRAEARIEEEMNIQVEENIYKEVKDWIGKAEVVRGGDRKEKKKKREEKKKKKRKENESPREEIGDE